MRSICLFFTLILTALSVSAQEINLSLSDAIYLGLRDNRSIRSAYLDRIAQKFDLRVSEDRFIPKLSLSGNYLISQNKNNRDRQAIISPAATLITPYGTHVSLGWTYRHTQTDQLGIARNDGANISLIQPLLRGAGKVIATAPVRLARLTEQANRLSLKSTVAQIITQVISAYHALLQAQEQLKISRGSLARARQLAEINRAMIAVGRMADFEIVQTQADIAAQELIYEEAKNQQESARLALLQLLSLNLHTPVVATETLQAKRVDINPNQALRSAEALQPDYLIRRIASEQASINLALTKNNRLWNVSLVGGSSQLHDRSLTGRKARSWENYVGVQVEIPLDNFDERQAEVHAQINVENQEISLSEAHQQLARDVTNALRDIDTRWRQYEISQRLFELSEKKLAIEREKLTVGRSSNFQVLSFEADLRNAENSKLSSLINYLNAQADLDMKLGTTLQNWDIVLND